MGGGKGGTTTSTSTSAPPADVMAQYDSLIAQANTQAAQPLQQYQGNIVAPLNQNQNTAIQDTANAQGTAQPYYNEAQGLIQNASQPITPSAVNASAINQYMNPYTQDVINSTMANLNQQDQGQQSQLAGNAAQQGAWGGDRSAVAQALLAHQQDMANNQTVAGLENQNYSQALGEANTQQQQGLSAQEASQYLGQQGGFGLMNLGTTAQNTALTGAGALNAAGTQQQQQQQEQMNVPYEQFQQQQAFPYQNLSWLSSLSTGLGSGMGGTSTTSQPAPNSSLGLFGLKRGGAISEGLIKRLASGGAIMMPPHYDGGGGIPDVSVGYIPGDTSLTRGSGIPQPPKPTPEQSSSALSGVSGLLGIGNSAKSLFGGAGKGASAAGSVTSVPGVSSADNPLGLTSGSNFTNSDISSLTSAFDNGTASDAAASEAPDFLSSIASFFKQGGPVGLIKHYDDGGGVTPFNMNTNPMMNNQVSKYAQMPVEQLQQMAMRVQQPQQKQMIQQALKQRQMMPNVGQPVTNGFTAAPQPTMARGGVAKYAFGGNVLPDIVSGVGDAIGAFFGDPGAGSQFTGMLSSVDGGETKPGLQLSSLFKRGGLIKGYDDGGDVIDAAQPVLLSGSANPGGNDTSAGLVKPDTSGVYSNVIPDGGKPAAPPVATPDANGFTPIPMPTFHDDKPTNEVNPWLSVLAGVAGAASGRSPYAIQNIAAGLGSGLKDYSEQKKEAADETYKNGSLQDARDNLVREAQEYNATGKKQADQYTQTLALDQQKADQTAKYQAGELANSSTQRSIAQQELDLKKKEASKPFLVGTTKMQYNPETNQYEKMGGAGASDQNAYGLTIGTVPQGTSAPVLDTKYDPTANMPPTQKAIADRNMQVQLEKDNAAAAINNDAIARLQASKNTIVTAPTGGLTNLMGVGPVATAFSTQRQEMDALNKELAMAPGERPANMRLTQGEVMMLKQAQPGTDKSPEANAAIADAGIAIRSRPSEFANFKNDFVANNGYWNDAIGQQMYNQYIKENPIIDVAKSGNGVIALNPKRQSIEQYANNGGFAKYGVPGNPQKQEGAGAAPTASNAAPVMATPSGVPAGSQYSPSKKQWRDSSGKLYDKAGDPI